MAGICIVGGTTLLKRSTDDLVLEIAVASQSNILDREGGKVLSMSYKGVFIFLAVLS